MKGFVRNNQYLSLCGLNCKLCPMNLTGHCSGCGVDNQSCKIAKCSIEHGKIEYCFQCTSFPCDKYAHIDDFDSFITHHNQMNRRSLGKWFSNHRSCLSAVRISTIRYALPFADSDNHAVERQGSEKHFSFPLHFLQ